MSLMWDIGLFACRRPQYEITDIYYDDQVIIPARIQRADENGQDESASNIVLLIEDLAESLLDQR